MIWLDRLLQKSRKEAQLQRELQEHLERQAADYMRSGLSEAEARRKARLTFGGVEQVKEECRDVRGTLWLESTLQDLRLAFRSLRKSPGFTFTALCTLALGIGANTAIFQLLDAVRLRSLPVPDPQSLALIQIEGGNHGFGVSDRPSSLSYPVWERIRREQRGFSGVFGWNAGAFDVETGVNIRLVKGLVVTGGFFPTLGITATGGINPIGRTFVTRQEPNYPAAQYEIVGVVKDTKYASLREEIPPQVFGPALQYPASSPDGTLYIRSAAPPAGIIAAVRKKLAQISPDIRSDYDVFANRIRDGLVRERLMAVLSGFFGVLAAMLAAIGLYGVISYMLVARRNETGIRLALGASRYAIMSGIVRQALRLVLLGTGLGLILALAATRSASSLLFGLRPDDPLMLAAAALLLGSVAFLASLLPALQASRVDPMVALRYE